MVMMVDAWNPTMLRVAGASAWLQLAPVALARPLGSDGAHGGPVCASMRRTYQRLPTSVERPVGPRAPSWRRCVGEVVAALVAS